MITITLCSGERYLGWRQIDLLRCGGQRRPKRREYKYGSLRYRVTFWFFYSFIASEFCTTKIYPLLQKLIMLHFKDKSTEGIRRIIDRRISESLSWLIRRKLPLAENEKHGGQIKPHGER